jgi:hypothetical protein
LQDADAATATEIRRSMKRKRRGEELMTTTLTTDHVIQSFSQLSLVGLAAIPPCPQQKKLRTSKYRSEKQQQHPGRQRKIKTRLNTI